MMPTLNWNTVRGILKNGLSTPYEPPRKPPKHRMQIPSFTTCIDYTDKTTHDL